MRFPLPRSSGPNRPRRGVTLIEMLVTVALLVLMMTIIVQVFQVATSSVSAQRTYQELDGSLRQLDSMIRTDLLGVTCKLTPPNDPKISPGYLEYGENAFADNQGEDTDDYIRFTTKAPEGQFFIGRMYLAPPAGMPAAPGPPFTFASMPKAWQEYFTSQPITITSQYAEVIYFLRNHNLYRRVFLIAPERQSAVNASSGNGYKIVPALGYLTATVNNVSWQGMNDLSARSAPIFTPNIIVLNKLSDLTNRENRAFAPRLFTDYVVNVTGSSSGFPAQDGLPDDENFRPDAMGNPVYTGDGIPDYAKTLYPNMVTKGQGALLFEPTSPPSTTYPPPMGIVGVPTRQGTGAWETMAFPYIYPGAYSVPEPNAVGTNVGWVHSLDPGNTTSDPNPTLASGVSFNHAPLDLGDNLPTPTQPNSLPQSWWGFPTWRETMSPNWTDPFSQAFSINNLQADGLHPFDPSKLPSNQAAIASSDFLPPLGLQPFNAPLYSDPAAGSGWFASYVGTTPNPNTINPALWEDDLILTGVRSFDVKAYDNSFPGYVDLGWGDDLRLSGGTTPYLSPAALTPATVTSASYAHEGRIPPLFNDNRIDAQFGLPTYLAAGSPYLPANGGAYTGNIGDDSTSVIRLRRVWDSWSTDYSNVPAQGFNPFTQLPTGPPFTPPVFPSYPPPYPQALRGIQIQVRVTDPRNERIKMLTIRHDFSDKL